MQLHPPFLMQISDHTLKNINILKILTFIIWKQLQLNFKFFLHPSVI